MNERILRRIRFNKRKLMPETKEDLKSVDILYPIVKSFSYIRIVYRPEEANIVYEVKEPVLAESEKRTLSRVKGVISEVLDVDFFGLKTSPIIKEYMNSKMEEILKKYSIKIIPESRRKIFYYLLRDLAGYGRVDSLMHDIYLEDIHCDGVGIPIYVTHRNYGSMRTNILFEAEEELESFVIKLAQWCGRHISIAEPLMDGSLFDGSRVQATYGNDVTRNGSTFTIRKFRETPLTPVDLILNGTVNSEILAYFWLAIENRASVLVSGGTATGKTTFLNVLSIFITPDNKIVSIEDTAELNIPHEHWIPAVARPGYGTPDNMGRRYGEVTMFDILKSSLRQRPDYIIVGEVRGAEAYVLFQGMATGHAGLATIHSDSIESLIRRLTTPPISLSPSLLEALDIVCFLKQVKMDDKPSRRLLNVVEVVGVSHGGELETSEVFKWKQPSDSFEFLGKSDVLNNLLANKGETAIWLYESEIWGEIERRKKILDWMAKNNMTDFREVSRVILEFYRTPEKVMKMVETGKKQRTD
ncbi:putative conjugal transfer protein/MT3759 [archaeon]|nr:putative conjugal transfer protein/MT3759 [archaeon]